MAEFNIYMNFDVFLETFFPTLMDDHQLHHLSSRLCILEIARISEYPEQIHMYDLINVTLQRLMVHMYQKRGTYEMWGL